MTFDRRRVLAAAALVVVGLVLLLGRCASSDPGVPVVADSPTISLSPFGTATPSTPAQPTEPAIADPGHGDEAASDGPGEEPPILVRPTDPTVQETAAQFAAAWLNTYRKTPAQWREGLALFVTDTLAEDLAYADPSTVPVGTVGSPITVSSQGSLWDADTPILDGPRGRQIGVLRLTLVPAGERVADGWLVSEIDWERS